MRPELYPYLKENAAHGSPEFPMGFYRCAFPGDAPELPVHWHEEMEFTRIRWGRLRYSVGLDSFEAAAGDLLLVLPGALHAARPEEAAGGSTDSILFHLRMLEGGAPDLCTRCFLRPLMDNPPPLAPVVRPGEEGYGRLRNCFEALWECREGGGYRPLRAKRALLELVELVWRSAGERDAPDRRADRYEEKLKLVLRYIHSHYTESITVAELAALCGFSPAHFMSVFKKYMNCGSVRYLNDYRLRRAASALLETDAPVTQVALDNGFQNISYFNRMFKQKYGTPPRAYRAGRVWAETPL
ncbi:MAG: AraC family transcriptional regulator [Oscillospiraceae bacterium]|nr:AraC family transcriptional regulator [Oscillospiraceae bacterium]